MPRRYTNDFISMDQVFGLRDSYSSSPGRGTTGIGQLVYAWRTDYSQEGTCLGTCVTGDKLVPGFGGGFCVAYNQPCCGQCCTCGFTIGNSTTVFVSLGAIPQCAANAATLWRRIR